MSHKHRKKHPLSISKKLFLLVDHSELGEKSLVRLCDINVIDYLITDNKVSIDKIRDINNIGVNAHITDK